MDSKNSPAELVVGKPQIGCTSTRRPDSKLTISTHVVDGREVTIVLDPEGELTWGAGR